MPSYFSAIAIMLPILGGLLLFLINPKKDSSRNIYVMGVVVLTTAVVLCYIINGTGEELVIFKLTNKLIISFKVDGLGKLFSTLVAVLWPLASLYAYEYMEHEDRKNSFFAFYTMTFGSVLGIAFAGNLLTMYIFYELLTLFTFPLVMHPMTEEAEKAAKTYLIYSLGGAAFAFIGIIFIMNYGSSLDFTFGGVLSGAGNTNLLLFVYVITFCGFSVKAAMFPFSRWLIKASVAPTPVTALLHAVAVVKAGVFAIMRVTYYIFGYEFLASTWAQYTVMILAMITILYGSCMAVREQHFKRRLAYSTISNLSYILLAVTQMSPLGFAAGMAHMVIHAVMKICSFFCAGAVMHKTDKNYIFELNGIGHKMKIVFAAFTISSFSLIGIPMFAGFVSKWRIAIAAINTNQTISYIAVGVLMTSAFLTAIYMLTVVLRAYFPADNALCENYEKIKDPGICMKLPLIIFSIAIIVIGVYWKPIMDVIGNIAGINL